MVCSLLPMRADCQQLEQTHTQMEATAPALCSVGALRLARSLSLAILRQEPGCAEDLGGAVPVLRTGCL